MNNDAVKNLVELAKEMNHADPINLGELTISEDEVYNLFALHIIEKLEQTDDAVIVIMTSLLHVLVENFVLNLKLNGGLDYVGI